MQVVPCIGHKVLVLVIVQAVGEVLHVCASIKVIIVLTVQQ